MRCGTYTTSFLTMHGSSWMLYCYGGWFLRKRLVKNSAPYPPWASHKSFAPTEIFPARGTFFIRSHSTFLLSHPRSPPPLSLTHRLCVSAPPLSARLENRKRKERRPPPPRSRKREREPPKRKTALLRTLPSYSVEEDSSALLFFSGSKNPPPRPSVRPTVRLSSCLGGSLAPSCIHWEEGKEEGWKDGYER